MENTLLKIIKNLENFQPIIDKTVESVFSEWKQKYPKLLSEAEFRQQTQLLITEVREMLKQHQSQQLPEIQESATLQAQIKTISKTHAELGIRPGDTAKYISELKYIIMSLNADATVDRSALQFLQVLDKVVNDMAILSFDSYMQTRERIITQQSESLLELSVPALRLWDKVVLVPLVGVIDTIRARLFTEQLLEAISEYEAMVAIIDVTAVPVFDTGVAQHLMKSIQAANLLGSQIIMTGLSPEGAQILTKLSVTFNNVISRTTLRAGVAEAMHLIGYRISMSQQ